MLKLKEYREKSGLSQARLAKILNVPASTYGNWEQGTREPNIDMLTKIAVVLNVTVDDLVDFKNKLEKIHVELNKKILEKDNAPKN